MEYESDAPLEAELNDVSHLASPIALGTRLEPRFNARAQQQIISNALVDAITGRGPRFIAVSVAQQFGKSFCTSYLAPLWWQELHALEIVQGGYVGLVSYEDSLPIYFSNKIKRTIQANESFLNTRIRRDAKAATFWETEAGGGLIAVGVGGAIVGRSISLFVIDDPTKNAEQASSETHRNSIWDWWLTVALGRLQPWTVVLVVHTRWREDDFIGRLMSKEFEGDPADWRYIRLPVICEEENDPLGREVGEPLLRPMLDITVDEMKAEMEFVQRTTSQYSWSTLWQQNPVDPEGTILFEKAWRYWGGDSGNTLPEPSDFDLVMMSWDFTFKDKVTNDWVVGQCWGRKGADYYLLAQERGHWGFTESAARIKSFAARMRQQYPKANGIIVEDKANGPALMEQLRSVVGGFIEFDPRDFGDKVQRANAIQPFLLGGNLYIPAPSEREWVRQFVKECSDFPRAVHDDCVDAATQAILQMSKYQPQIATVLIADDVDTPRSALDVIRR